MLGWGCRGLFQLAFVLYGHADKALFDLDDISHLKTPSANPSAHPHIIPVLQSMQCKPSGGPVSGAARAYRLPVLMVNHV